MDSRIMASGIKVFLKIQNLTRIIRVFILKTQGLLLQLCLVILFIESNKKKNENWEFFNKIRVFTDFIFKFCVLW